VVSVDTDVTIFQISEFALNIYFSCSITGGRDQQEIYAGIVKYLLEKGHEVPTAHLASDDVIEKEIIADAETVYRRDIDWVRGCDVLVAEVSTPSHGVGYEIAAALYEGKPVFCCYLKDITVSKMITGNFEVGMQIYVYETITDLLPAIQKFLASLR